MTVRPEGKRFYEAMLAGFAVGGKGSRRVRGRNVVGFVESNRC